MSKYDQLYSIAFPRYHLAGCVLLKPDKATRLARYGERRIPPGKPLIFTNAYPDRFGPGKHPETLTDVHFRGAHMMAREWFKDFLAQFDIDDLQLYPSIYIDTSGNYHDGYWFLNITEELDCWDRVDSDYEEPDIDEDDEDADLEFPTIARYSLDARILDRIPEEQRLIFRMGGTDDPLVFIHNKVRQFLEQRSATGIRLFRVTDYVKGMDIRP